LFAKGKEEKNNNSLFLSLFLTFFLLERDEPRRRRRPNTRLTVLDGLVRDRKLAQVVAHHVRLHLDLVERLAVVDTNDGSDHFRDDDGVAEVGADCVGLLARLGRGALGGAKLLDEGEGLALEAALEAVDCLEEEVEEERGERRGKKNRLLRSKCKSNLWMLVF